MKRINAQWVFLIILALWIPVLCFADEVTMDDAVHDKVERLQYLEQLKTVVSEQKQVQEKIDSEPSVFTKAYGIGLIIFAGVGGALAIAIAASAFWESIKFNYHLYVANGTFCFVKTDDMDEERARNGVATAVKGLNPKEVHTYGWFTSLGMVGTGILFITLLVLLWPLAIIFIGPQLVINLIAYRKRKKQIFNDKLKGNPTNGIV